MDEFEWRQKVLELLMSIDSRLNTIEMKMDYPQLKSEEVITEKPRQEYKKSYEKKADWKNEPATEKQIQLLMKHGISEEGARHLTKGEASLLLDKLLGKRG